MRAKDVIDTLTGFDEIGLAKVTGTDLDFMVPSMLVRAMAAVLISREEEKTSLGAAWQRVSGMTRAQVEEWWDARSEDGDDEDDVIEDDPDTAAGKDDSETVSEPNSSPFSSSTPDSASATTSS